MEKNLCIREVPSFTIENSEGANNVYETIPMRDDWSGLKIRFLMKHCHLFASISHGFLGQEVGHFCKISSSVNSQSEDVKVGYCYKWARLTYFGRGNLGHVTGRFF